MSGKKKAKKLPKATKAQRREAAQLTAAETALREALFDLFAQVGTVEQHWAACTSGTAFVIGASDLANLAASASASLARLATVLAAITDRAPDVVLDEMGDMLLVELSGTERDRIEAILAGEAMTAPTVTVPPELPDGAQLALPGLSCSCCWSGDATVVDERGVILCTACYLSGPRHG